MLSVQDDCKRDTDESLINGHRQVTRDYIDDIRRYMRTASEPGVSVTATRTQPTSPGLPALTKNYKCSDEDALGSYWAEEHKLILG